MVGVTDEGVALLGRLACLRELDLQFCWQFGDEGECVGRISLVACGAGPQQQSL